MTLRAIVFGVDGVLAETQEARREAFNKVFVEAGLDWHWGRVLYAQLLKATDGKEMIQAFVDRHRPHAGARTMRHETTCPCLKTFRRRSKSARGPRRSGTRRRARSERHRA